MKIKKLFRMIVGLAIAFVMTFTPALDSYAVIGTSASEDGEQVVETQAPDEVPEQATSEQAESSHPEMDLEDPDAVEQTEPEMRVEAGPEDEVTEKAEKTEYVWKDKKVRVTAVLSDAAAIPDDAELIVAAVNSKSDGYDYDAYMDALNEKSDSKYDAKNTLLYDIAFIKDGVEIQPESGTVSVTFEFLDNQLSESIGAKKASDVNVIHLPLKDKVKDKCDTTADAKKLDADDIVVEALTKKDNELAVSVKNEKVKFETSDFSIYAYTVDFEYTDPETGQVYTFNLDGAGSITLKELAIILGITTKADADEFIDNVENVTFSNENLVKVKKTLLKGWVLKSLAPFSSEELLTITMKDGTVIEVRVTDTQESTDLTNFLTNAVIAGATQNENGEYQVETGKDYNIILSFAEGSSYQFKNNGTLTYQIPAGIVVLEEQDEPFKINITYKGRTYQVNADCHLGTDGLLEVTFKQDDPNYPRLVDSTNVSFRFTYHAQFDGTEDKIKFSDDIERDVIFDNPDQGQAYAKKTATYDETTGTFHYTITVTATGDVTNVNVKDTVIGDALIVNQNSISITGNSSTPTGGMNSTGFEYTFPSMAKDEVITITYDATVDFSKDIDKDGIITADQTKNTLSVKPKDGEPHNSEYSREINYKYTVKKNGEEASTTAQGDKIINWEIEYNPLALVAVGGDKITDRISAASVAYMKYYGSGITVKAYDRSGVLQYNETVSYNSLNPHTYSEDEQTWTYTIPSNHTTPYRYVITYQTIVDMEKVADLGTGVTLDNTANDDGGSVHVIPEDTIDVVKEVDSYTTEEVTWNSTLTIPERGLTSAVVTDYLPGVYLDDGRHTDVLKNGTLEITGLLPGESYDITYNTGSIVIKFYKDAGKTQTGLQASSGPREVHVKLTTKVDQDWLEYGYEEGGYYQNHTNSIDLNGVSDTATVIYGKPGLEKTAELVETKDPETGKIKQSLKYTITIAGLQEEPFHLSDTFDTSLLEVDTSKTGTSDHMYMYGGTQYSQIAGKTPVSYTDTTTGIDFTVNTVPKQENGNYYPYYMISYYLKLKDDVDLEQLAIANGGEYDITNKAVWADHETEYTYKVVYDYLDKELLNAEGLGGTVRTGQYKITFNPAKATLNDGEPMEMKDVLSSNLSLDYTSIRITTDPAGAEVPYSISRGKDENGNYDGTTVATYTVPDSTKVVITYNAEVRGDGTQTIINKVSVKDDEDTSQNTHNYGAADEGEGAVASFRIVKVDGYDANKKLSGVRFRIFAENPELDFGEKVHHATEIELVTDENGEILLDGDQYDFYFNECYHVQEIEAHEDYEKIGFDYLVTITNDMSLVDYGEYIYYYSDTMQIKNWPLEGLIVEKQVESNDEGDKDKNFEFKVTVLDENGDPDTSYNGKHGDDQFTNGVTTFLLKDGEHHMLWGFTKGTRYKVEEIDDQGFATTVTYTVIDEDGTHTVTEDSSSHSGTLTQEHETIVFTNSRSTGEVKVKKNLVGREWRTNDSFEFTITPVGNAPAFPTPTVTVTKNDAPDYTKSFGKVTFTEAGTYQWTVSETHKGETINGVSYDSADKTVTIKVVDDGNGNFVADEGSALVQTAAFTNTYSNPSKGEVKVKKTLSGREWTTDDSFEFTITPVGNAPAFTPNTVTVTKNSTDYTESFGKVTFTEAGTYQWTVTETHKGETINGVNYAAADRTVTIKVVDDGNGNLVPDTGSALVQTAAFTNTYSKSGEGEVKVKKTLSGRDWTTDDSFEFTITPVGNAPAFTPNTVTVTKNSTDYTESFGKVTFTEAGTYQWTVSETHKGETINGVNYAAADRTVTIKVVDDGNGNLVPDTGSALVQTAEFTNTYSKSGEGEVKVQKTLSGRDWTTNDSFEFTITPVGNAPAFTPNTVTVTKNSTDYTESFGKVTFTEAGTYEWTVSETHKGETINGVSYDSADKTVTIVVKDDGKGNLVPDTGSALVKTAAFTNTYSKSGEGEVKVQKTLSGREWKTNDSFEFTITPKDGAPAFTPNTVTVTKNSTDYTESFGKVTFTEAGTYQWTVSETHKGETIKGVNYDAADRTVTIKVVDDGNGNLVPDTGSALVQTAAFTNTYSKSGEGEVKVKKTLSGRDWTTDDSFEFTITPVGNAPAFTPNTVTVTKNSTDYTESFGKVTFTEAGTYQWTVSETHKGERIKGVNYAAADRTVTIVVKDDGEGNLVPDTGSALVQTAAFTNTYSAEGEGEVKVKKTLSGRDWTTNDSFEFTITPVGNAPAFTPNTITVTKNSTDYTESFGKVTFTEAGTYQWTVTETHKGETINGVNYAAADKTVTIKVVDDGNGNLVPDTGSALVQTAAFTNTYSAEGEGEVKAKKTLSGRDWTTDDSFEFTITPVGNAPAFPTQTVTITKNDAADYMKSFGKVKFTEAGTYQWTVTETHKGQTINGVNYAAADRTVTIKVVDDGNGNLVADEDSALIQTATFTNTYSAEGEGEVKVKKTLSGREWKTDDRFEFTITPVGNAPAFTPNKVTVTKNSTDYTESFGEVTFTEAGTYQWTVTETHKGETVKGVKYDAADRTVTIKVVDDGKGHLVPDEGGALIQTAEFTNTYSASGKGEVKAKKTLSGRDWTTNDSFEFTITPVGNAPAFPTQTVTITKNDAADYMKSFGEVTFTKAGTYQWTVSETHKGETIKGVKYDAADRTVTINVVDDGEGHLVADEGSALIQTAEFTNTYSASGKGEVKVKKTLSGREWKTNDSFEFTITPVGNAPAFMPNKVTVTKNSADYTESFGEVTFTKAGTYHWTVTEEHKGETIKGVAYDSADKTVTIVVKDDGEGHLVADEGSALVKTAEFTNTYSKSGEGEVKVQKTLIGREWTTDDSFEFTITPVGNAPALPTQTVTITKNDAADYTKSFGKVKFTEAGTYQWTVSETHKGETIKGVKYDAADKTVTIKVVDDGEGHLVADQGSALVQTAAFTNTYSAEGEGEVKVKKTLNGHEWKTNDKFEFTITPVGDAPKFTPNKVTVTKDSADYTESFGKVKFTKAGTYQWTVTEEHKGETIKGVAYDSADKTVTIVVKDDGEGHLVAEEGSALVQTAPFTNTYSAEGEGEVKVKKTLSGRDWTTNDSFEFTITPVGNAPAFPTQTVTITKVDAPSYTKSFGRVAFTEAGTYQWTVTETHKGETLKGITYDSTDKTVTIEVVDDGEGNFVADQGSALIQTAEFTNTYNAKGSIPLKGTKKFKYGSFDDEEFSFSVYTETDFNEAVDPGLFSRERDRNDSDFIAQLQDKKLLTASTSGAQVGEDGTASFDFKTADGKDLEYTLADISDGDKTEGGYLTKEFKYVVVEDIPEEAVKKTVGDETFYYDGAKDIKYDGTEYHVTITVTDKGDGTLDVRTSDEVMTFGFVNEKIYTELKLTKDIDSLVTGDTEGELTNVTCVFKVTYNDPILGREVSRTVSVQFDAEKVAAETATVDKIPIEAEDSLKIEEVYAVDYTGQLKEGEALRKVDSETGIPFWTVAFENERNGNKTGSGVINSVEKNEDGFVITKRRDSTGKNPPPEQGEE